MYYTHTYVVELATGHFSTNLSLPDHLIKMSLTTRMMNWEPCSPPNVVTLLDLVATLATHHPTAPCAVLHTP